MLRLQGLPLLADLMSSAWPDIRPLYHPERMRFVFGLLPEEGGPEKSTEDLRQGLVRILSNESFLLEPLFRQPPIDGVCYVTFSPEGLDRVLPDEMLLDLAKEFQARLGVISCEADLTGQAIARAIGAENAKGRDTCEGSEQGGAQVDPMWALRNLRVPQAWAQSAARGAGICIAQPDTGVTDHAELAQTQMDFTKTLNLIEGGLMPTDPLLPSMANPGHGTATASVIASGAAGHVTGVAPEAVLVPIRCVNDVKLVGASAVARAVDHAVTIGAHIITISLGGFWSRPLRAAIRRAVSQDIIVLAAAGNHVGAVVWPAAYPEVIAVAGTTITDSGWSGSSTGAAVDVFAPAQCVWRAESARQDDGFSKVGPGNGTSYAAALTAGVAALWLSHHGPQNVRVAARRRDLSVQELFRTALTQTARPKVDLQGVDQQGIDQQGAGIVDAAALIDWPLSGALTGGASGTSPEALSRPGAGSDVPLPHAARSGQAGEYSDLANALEFVLGPGVMDRNVDWSAHGQEVSALLLGDAAAGRRWREAGDHRAARGFMTPSKAILTAASQSSDARLAQLVLRGPVRAPAVQLRAERDPPRLGRLLSGLAAARTPGLNPEAVSAIPWAQAQQEMGPDVQAELLEKMHSTLRAPQQGQAEGVVQQALKNGLRDLHLHGVRAAMDEATLIQLEALVALTERPVVPVFDRICAEGPSVQSIKITDPRLGRYAGVLGVSQGALEAGPLAGVGLIESGDAVLGCGVVIAPGLVMTTRYVAEMVAFPVPGTQKTPGPQATQDWRLHKHCHIDFSPDGQDRSRRFAVTRIAWVSPRAVQGMPCESDVADLAVICLETENALCGGIPAPVPLMGLDFDSCKPEMVCAINYLPHSNDRAMDMEGRIRQQVAARMLAVFGVPAGQKCLSPGQAGTLRAGRWFEYDALIPAGLSGAPLITLGAECRLIGLHHAGDGLCNHRAQYLPGVLDHHPDLRALLQTAKGGGS